MLSLLLVNIQAHFYTQQILAVKLATKVALVPILVVSS